MPPLSLALRDSPDPAAVSGRAAAYSFGVRPSLMGSSAAFQSALPPAVLLPESFRGGCSFGAALPDLGQGATSPAGVHTAAPCVAPQKGGGQPFATDVRSEPLSVCDVMQSPFWG